MCGGVPLVALTDYEHQRMAEEGTHRPETLPDIIIY